MNTELQKLNEAARLLAECKTLDEFKKIHNIADAARQYAEVSKLGNAYLNHANEIKIRAERKMGEILMKKIPHQGGRPSENSVPQDTVSTPTLEELGISRHDSARFQKIASIPEAILEEHMIQINENMEKLTIKGVLKLAKSLNGEGESQTHKRIHNSIPKTVEGFIEMIRKILSKAEILHMIELLTAEFNPSPINKENTTKNNLYKKRGELDSDDYIES